MTPATFALAWLGLLLASLAVMVALAVVLAVMPTTALAGLLGLAAVVAASRERGQR